jgi:drug/metabolite transporter (DMT)-like permease
MAVTASALFAVNGVVSKGILLAGMPALQLTQLRSLGAFVGIGLFLAIAQPAKLRLTRREIPLLAVYGIIGFAFVQLFYFVAIRELPVGIALLLEYTAPILIALWARFGEKQPLRARFWWALALAMFGLSLVAQVWSGEATLERLGVVAGFAAAFSLAVYFVVGERVTASGRRDPVSLTCYAFGFASAFLTVVSPWPSFPFDILGQTSTLGGITGMPVWALAAWMVTLGTIAPFLLIIGSLRHLSATGASVVGMVEPVLAFAVAWVVLDEALTALQIAGAGLLLTGVLLAETSRFPRDAP